MNRIVLRLIQNGIIYISKNMGEVTSKECPPTRRRIEDAADFIIDSEQLQTKDKLLKM